MHEGTVLLRYCVCYSLCEMVQQQDAHVVVHNLCNIIKQTKLLMYVKCVKKTIPYCMASVQLSPELQ
jgi:hypothetical protein